MFDLDVLEERDHRGGDDDNRDKDAHAQCVRAARAHIRGNEIAASLSIHGKGEVAGGSTRAAGVGNGIREGGGGVSRALGLSR